MSDEYKKIFSKCIESINVCKYNSMYDLIYSNVPRDKHYLCCGYFKQNWESIPFDTTLNRIKKLDQLLSIKITFFNPIFFKIKNFKQLSTDPRVGEDFNCHWHCFVNALNRGNPNVHNGIGEDSDICFNCHNGFYINALKTIFVFKTNLYHDDREYLWKESKICDACFYAVQNPRYKFEYPCKLVESYKLDKWDKYDKTTCTALVPMIYDDEKNEWREVDVDYMKSYRFYYGKFISRW